jgi:division/cell wall cluster transcriptional repressor MraZ
MLFTGETERSIDEKQRISIPAEMRGGFLSGIVYASPGPNDTIWLSPEQTFEKKASFLEQSLLPDEDIMEFEQILFSQSRRIELDKQGRIRLPEALLTLAAISEQAYVLGVGDHLEVLNHQKWEATKADKLSRLREYMVRARKQTQSGRGTQE